MASSSSGSGSPGRDLVLELASMDEMFDAPDCNPFSTRELEVLGEAAVDHIGKQVMRVWPRRPYFERVVLSLPADQVTPDATAQAREALRRTCDAQLAQNRYERRFAMRIGKRQMAIALPIVVIAVPLLLWILTWPTEGTPGFLTALAAVLIVFAASLAIWDAIESLAFNWVPFVLDDARYRAMRELEVVITAATHDDGPAK